MDSSKVRKQDREKSIEEARWEERFASLHAAYTDLLLEHRALQERLTEMQYYVLRGHGTEHPFTSPLDKVYEAGTYHCAGCGHPLFSSETKYDSRTGWPSFWEPLDGAIGTREDHSFFMVRTEVHCARCGGHLGHVFNDGPPPTGLRYCMNGLALDFRPAESA